MFFRGNSKFVIKGVMPDLCKNKARINWAFTIQNLKEVQKIAYVFDKNLPFPYRPSL